MSQSTVNKQHKVILMNYKELKKEIQEIVKIAQDVPEEFRDKCFEVLLECWTEDSRDEYVAPRPVQGDDKTSASVTQDGDESKIPISTAMKVLMRKTGITQEQLAKVLVFESDEVHFVEEPSPKTTAEGSVQWALLLALKNVIAGQNEFQVDPEELRSMCQEKACYDRKNFWTTFSGQKYSVLFSGPLKPQGKPRKLTDQGKNELGRLIATLAGE